MISFAEMGKALTYIILVLIMAQETGLDQLAKLPTLFSHFNQHQRRDQRVSFIDYLAMHYCGNDINDDDDKEDMQLPFKRVELRITQTFTLPEIQTVIRGQYVKFIRREYPEHQQLHFPDPGATATFRPPCFLTARRG